MMIMIVLLMLGCSPAPQEFDREAFEDKWWEFPQYPVCFNFHGTGDVLLYENRISNEGPWYYCEPNYYEFKDGQELVQVTVEDECWKIEGYSELASFIVCECTLR